MLSAAVQEVLKVAVQEVQRRRHELLTVEHILFSLTTVAPGRLLLEGSGASVAVLREQLEGFFRNEMQVLPDQGEHEVHQTAGVQRVLERALGHIHASGRSQVELGDLFVAILDEEDSYAHYFLTRQGVDRLDALTFITHGMPEGGGSRGVAPDAAKGKEEGEAGENVLEKYATELTARAREGRIDPLVGRQEELDRAIEVLCRRRKNNPLFVGDPGVGKTALAEGLALRIAQGQVPKKFKDVKIYALDMGLILAGTRYRGEFESRLKAIVEELRAIPDAVVFIDEIHTIVGAGATSGGSMDASNLLKPVLASGELRCIGSTTHEEFRNHLEKDRALTRRFQRIDVGEPDAEDCLAILNGLQAHYAGHHRVRYSETVLRSIVDLSNRYVRDRLQPDKAIDVMDEVGAAVDLRRKDDKRTAAVTVADVERVVARMAGVPVRTVSGQERNRLANLEKNLKQIVFGQEEAVEQTVRAILRSRAGLGQRLPLLWSHRCGQDGAGPRAGPNHGSGVPALRHERIYGAAYGLAAHRFAAGLCGLRPGRSADRGRAQGPIFRGPAGRDRKGPPRHLQHPAAGHGLRHPDGQFRPQDGLFPYGAHHDVQCRDVRDVQGQHRLWQGRARRCGPQGPGSRGTVVHS